MKKLMILAVAALACAACAKTYEVKETTPPAIGFDSWANVLTRTKADDAPHTPGTTSFASGDTFAVYGYKEKNSPAGSETVFNGVKVTYTTSWSYVEGTETLRYWDNNYDKYVFYGVSPSAAVTNAAITATSGAMSIPVTFAGNNNDILIAKEKTVNKTDTPVNFGNGSNAYGTVSLDFVHVASLVDVYVKKVPTLTNDVEVSAFSLENIAKKGTLAITTYDNTTHAPTVAVSNWSIDATDGTGTFYPANGVTPVYGNDNSTAISSTNKKTIAVDTGFNATNTTANTDPAGSTCLINNLVVMPQTFGATGTSTSQKISMTYSIANGGEHTATLYLSDFDKVDNADQAATFVGSWEPGKHYKFYITIGANAITFTASITDWTAGDNGYHYLTL